MKICSISSAYVESAGKYDKSYLKEAFRRQGASTVLRVCLGASTDTLPLRSLGYITSAMTVAKECLPRAQVQIIQTIHTGIRVNGLPEESARRAAETFRTYGRRLIGRLYPELAGQVSFLFDDPRLPEADEADIAGAVDAAPLYAREKLRGGAERRQNGRGYLAYVAAHLLMHDTVAGLQPMADDEPEAVDPKCIVSLGAQSERPFYEARMAFRRLGKYVPGMVDETGQLFTRHSFPPYIACREGEPPLMPLEQITREITDHPVPSVHRDLEYLYSVLQGGAR